VEALATLAASETAAKLRTPAAAAAAEERGVAAMLPAVYDQLRAIFRTGPALRPRTDVEAALRSGSTAAAGLSARETVAVIDMLARAAPLALRVDMAGGDRPAAVRFERDADGNAVRKRLRDVAADPSLLQHGTRAGPVPAVL
jgi:hypothetical protein